MIRLLYDTTIGGIRHGKGSVINLDRALELDLLAKGNADRGTGVFSRDSKGNIVGLEADEGTIPLALSYTWNTRPNAYTTAAGTIINIRDVGGEAGSLWKATAAGWVPLNGTVKLASKWGSVASPVASIMGSTGGLFAINGGAGSLVVPATMLIPGRSILRVRALIHRRGANATAIVRIYLGTAGTSSDGMIFSISLAATDTLQTRPDIELAAITSSSMTSTDWLTPGNNGSPGVIRAVSTNINTEAAMTISFSIISANTLDSFDLIGYSVVLESL